MLHCMLHHMQYISIKIYLFGAQQQFHFQVGFKVMRFIPSFISGTAYFQKCWQSFSESSENFDKEKLLMCPYTWIPDLFNMAVQVATNYLVKLRINDFLRGLAGCYRCRLTKFCLQSSQICIVTYVSQPFTNVTFMVCC